MVGSSGGSGAPIYLEDTDECYYARERVSGARYDATECNGLISNFQKGPERRGRQEWKYKERAAHQFAAELAEFLPNGDGMAVVFVPTSKCRTDDDYDDRFDMVAADLTRHRSDLELAQPIQRARTVEKTKAGGTTRKVERVRESLSWSGFDGDPPNIVVLIDDVITAGTHFKACKNLILEHHAEIEVVGVFWAKTVWPSPFDDET